MTRPRVSATLARRGLLLLLLVPASGAVMAIEEPPFRLLEHDAAFELRDYPPELIAETRVRADFDAAGNEGFRRLLRYISGANRSRTKLAMTAPVTQAPLPAGAAGGEKLAMTAPVTQTAAEGAYRVAFVMPAGYTAATLPLPTDPAIEIRDLPARLLAVWRYSGRWSESRYREMEAALRAALPAHHLVAVGAPIFARYDAPFVPWPFRRNEVQIPVSRAQ